MKGGSILTPIILCIVILPIYVSNLILFKTSLWEGTFGAGQQM